MRADEVLVTLVQRDLRLPSDHQIELIRHGVGLNWRQRFRTPRQQICALDEALHHDGPFFGCRVPVRQLAGSITEQLRCRTAPPALSVASRVWNAAGEHVGHLALMNLHPVGFSTTAQLRSAVDRVTDGMPGYLLSSGRYFHYYGMGLLDSDAWVGFLAQFLMPCVLVSPRYIGHSMHRGFCALRLNAVPPHKPVVPEQVVVWQRIQGAG